MYGSHLSIAGGMVNALHEATRLRLDTVQVFTKNQQQWKVRPLDPGAVSDWLTELRDLGWEDRTVSHASYLINLASPDDELWKKSIDLMCVELHRCAELSIPFLVHHPGAYTSSDEASGLKRIALAYHQIFKSTSGVTVVSCLENTVGSGSNLGRTFDQLGHLRTMIVEATGAPDRIGFCFDTCHAHAGGYDLSTRDGAELALDDFDARCGLEHLRVLHMNDSKKPAGCRRDRHEHIGEGTIGLKPLSQSGFAAVVNRAELADVPRIMETPKGENAKGTAYDTLNLRRLRRLEGTPHKRGARTGASRARVRL